MAEFGLAPDFQSPGQEWATDYINYCTAKATQAFNRMFTKELYDAE